ncbi:MAG: putative tellurite resistance protein B-like protein [Motiliproteus sp.]|jgi:uncharacterized tellurite resistance protein B-like protein
MINRITAFFSNHIALASGDKAQPLQLATAALLLEVSRADFTIDDAERDLCTTLLKKQFQLPAAQLDTLIKLAQQQTEQAISLYPFTRLIDTHYSAQQKSLLIFNLWQVALSDGSLDKYEDHLIRKVADLIHVSHSEFIRTKLAAIDANA